MHLNILGSGGAKVKRRPSSKTKQRSNKKSYSKKFDSFGKRLSNGLSGKGGALEEFSSPYKLNKKSKDFLNQVTLSSNEYSNYIKQKHINALLNNFSLESSASKSNKRTISHVAGSKVGVHKPSITKKMASTKHVDSQRKKKARSKTKSEKSVVFMMPGQHTGNQFIHYCK